MKSEWKECLFGSQITLKRGYDLPSNKRIDGDVPIISSSGVSGRHNVPMVKAPGVITGRYGTIGQVFYTDEDFWPLNTTLYVEDFHGNDPKFVYYFLQTFPWNLYTEASAVPGINRNAVHIAKIKIPDIDTQKKIAGYLECLDGKIELNNQINENLQQQAQAIFKAWFVDFEPFGGVMPENWREGTISDLGNVVGGSTPSKAKSEYYTENGIAWITPKDLSRDHSLFIYRGETDITEEGLKNSSASIMPRGTVLFSSRAPIGYIAIAGGDVTTNQGFKSVVPFDHIETAYVYYCLKNNLPTIEGMASGSTFKEVSGSVMKSVPVIVPDEESLSKFSGFCNPLFEEQEELEWQNRRLSEIRNELLVKLMTL